MPFVVGRKHKKEIHIFVRSIFYGAHHHDEWTPISRVKFGAHACMYVQQKEGEGPTEKIPSVGPLADDCCCSVC